MDIRQVIGAPGRRGVALAAAVLTLGLATGAAAAVSLTFAERDAAAASLDLRAADVRSAMETTFQRYADTIHDLVASASVRPDRQMVEAIAGDRLPGAHQVLVVGADHTVLVQHAVDGSAPPPIERLQPGPELAQAMTRAHTTGRLVTGAAHMLDADRAQPGFEMAAPLPGDTFRGWVIVSVRAGDLLASSLNAAGVTGVTATLAGISPLARWSEGGPAAGPEKRFDVALAGTVTVRATTALVSPARSAAAPLTMLAAALISLLLAAIVLLAVGSRGRALQLARRVSDRRAAETDRADRAEQEARELTGFTSAAGQHLLTPLHAIAGLTELLLEESPLDPASRGFLDRIGHNARRMLGTVDEMAAAAGTDDTSVNLEPVDLEHLTLDVAASLSANDGERPRIEVGDLPMVTADPVLLRQVLDHLIGNAARFVRNGTIARISIGAQELPDGWWRIEVADHGIGVPEDQRARVFAPFHRTPVAEGYPGAGLGLAVCRRIVALHGGEIGVRPNPGGGSVFFFTVSATGVTLSAAELQQLAAA